MTSTTQALQAINPSLIQYMNGGGAALSAIGNGVNKYIDDTRQNSFRDAKLKLEQDDSAAKNQYYQDMAETKRMAVEQKAKDLQAEADKSAANIAVIKALHPDVYRSVVESQGGAGSYLDPSAQSAYEKPLAYVKLSDLKDKTPSLQHVNLANGEIGVFNPTNGDIRGTGVKGDYTNPYALADYHAKLALNKAEDMPTAQNTGEKISKIGDYLNKGYAAQGLTGDPAKDKIIKSYSFGAIDGKYLIPPANINAFQKEIGLK